MDTMITLHEYDPRWREIFKEESCKINAIMPSAVVHHIGSTGVPFMLSKPDIDILCEVDDINDKNKLSDAGYQERGELNIPMRYFFNSNSHDRKINLHLVEKGQGLKHWFSDMMLLFRDYLRDNAGARDEYIALKKEILKDPASHEKNSAGFPKYTLCKNEFIKRILDDAGFRREGFTFCLHEKEWSEYHRIKKEQIIERHGGVYDPNHPSITSDQYKHFVLYEGTAIIGITVVEILRENVWALRAMAIDAPFQRQGLGSVFLPMIEKWLLHKGCRSIHLHAHPDAYNFYARLGYMEKPFDFDPEGIPGFRVIDMMKRLL